MAARSPSKGYDHAGFWRAVTRDGRARCWVCEHLRELGMTRVALERERCELIAGPLDAHHLLAKQVLRRELRAKRLTARTVELLLADARNGIPVRRYHHGALEARRIRIPWRLLPGAAVDFAEESGLEPLLRRYYPEEV